MRNVLPGNLDSADAENASFSVTVERGSADFFRQRLQLAFHFAAATFRDPSSGSRIWARLGDFGERHEVILALRPMLENVASGLQGQITDFSLLGEGDITVLSNCERVLVFCGRSGTTG